jgi:hypothetical protein
MSRGWLSTGRIVDEDALHVGVRPALYWDGSELDVGVTLQVTVVGL